MNELAKYVPIFPFPKEVMSLGDKAGLTAAAAESIGYQQPLVCKVEPTYELAKKIWDRKVDCVVKRTRSESGIHVILPGGIAMSEERFAEVRAMEAFWESAGFERPIWLKQTYVPQLVHVGELCSLVVNGILFHTICTTSIPGVEDLDDDALTVTSPHNFTTLELLR